MKTISKSSLILSTVFLSQMSLLMAKAEEAQPSLPQPNADGHMLATAQDNAELSVAPNPLTEMPHTAYYQAATSSSAAQAPTAAAYPESYFYNIATGVSALAPDGSIPFYSFTYYTDAAGYIYVNFSAPVAYTLVLEPGTRISHEIKEEPTSTEPVVAGPEQILPATHAAQAEHQNDLADLLNLAYDRPEEGMSYLDNQAQGNWDAIAAAAQASLENFVVTTYEQDMAFISQIYAEAQEIAQTYKLYASVMIAQALWESHAGTSALGGKPYYNLFGIKGNYYGNSVTFQTIEDDGTGNLFTVNADFRAYPSYRGSLEDYAQLLRSEIYRGTWLEHADSYLDATAALTGVYATDVTYHDKINAVIATYDLTRFD